MAICYPFGCRPCGQITTPLVYDESLSVAQQIAMLCGRLHQMDIDFVNADELKKVIEDFNDDQDSQTQALKGYTNDEIDKLRVFIAGISAGMEIWDVTHGRFDKNATSLTRLFNDVTVHAITVDQLAALDLTVDTLADCGLNVRGLAVFSGYLTGDTFTVEGITYEGTPLPDNALTVKILAHGVVQDGYFVQGNEG